MPWHARSLRLTAFPMPGSDLSQAPNWQGLVGQAPEATVSRAGQVVETGPLRPGVLQLAKQGPLRADLVLSAVPNPEGPDPELPALGVVQDAVAVFGPFAETFLHGSPPLQRIAFGADLVYPRQSRDEAYRYLTEAIRGARIDLDGASEFLYQINRPRESALLRGVRLNRLSKWSASMWQNFVFDATV